MPARPSQAALLWASAITLLAPQSAHAVPSFAAQTGQPCESCHIGAYGPELTAFGRAFKLGGYTLTGGQGVGAKIPLSMMFQGSFNATHAGQPGGAAPHYADNNNVTVDQISALSAAG